MRDLATCSGERRPDRQRPISSDARDLERRLVLAVKDRADRISTFASREKTLSDRRLAVLKLWGDLQK